MLSTYCQDCGSKNEYRLTKPKFCSSCGQSFTSDSTEVRANTKPEPPTKKRLVAEVHDEDGTDIYEVPNISNLEYEIEVSASTFQLGSILPKQNQIEKNSPQKKKRGRPRKNG